MGAKQQRRAAIVVAVVVLSGVVGGVVARTIKSPDELAARTAPPAPSLITAPVERRALSANVVVRGTGRHASRAGVTLNASTLKPAMTTFTSLPPAGSTLSDGGAALVVSGRPVFALTGALPMYRDLMPGVSGTDVRQLQEALARLGIDPGRTDGVYDGATGSAVATFYARAGWEPFGATTEQKTALRTTRDAVNQADERKLQAELAVQTLARTGLTDVRTAQSALGTAQAKADATAAALPSAYRAIDVARAAQVRDNAAAAADVANKANAVTAAADDVRAARAKLAGLPPGATPDDLAAAQTAVNRAVSALSAAGSDLAVARAAVTSTNVGGVAAVEKAQADAAQALRDAQAAADDRAGAQVALDEAARNSGPERGTLLASVAVAATQAAAARGDYAELAAHAGVQVPADEILFFPSLPLRVDDVTAKPGEQVKEGFMSVSGLQFVIDTGLSPTDAKLVSKGAEVAIEETDLKINAKGVVTTVADRPGTNGADAQKIYVEVTPADSVPQLLGASVRLTIAVKSTAGDVLAVPTSALSVGADGSTRLEVERADHTTTFVQVQPGLAAQGMVEVTPTKGELAPGDNVVVGATKPEPGTPTTKKA